MPGSLSMPTPFFVCTEGESRACPGCGKGEKHNPGRSYIPKQHGSCGGASLYPAPPQQEKQNLTEVWVGRENLASALTNVVPNPKQREKLLPDKNTPLGCHPRTGQWKQRVHVPAVLRVGMGRAKKPGFLCCLCTEQILFPGTNPPLLP